MLRFSGSDIDRSIEVEGNGCEGCEEEVAAAGCEARFLALLRVGLECCMKGRVMDDS